MLMYLKWAALGPASFLMAVVGRLLAPVLPFFVQDDGFLPDWLSWFQTPDNPMDGDAAHWERHPGTDAWSTYSRRVAWCWRNVAYGFDMSVCGAKCRPTDELLFEGDDETGAKPIHNGYEWRLLKRNGKPIYFQFYCVRQWPFWKSRCLRINLGWKLWDFPDKYLTCQWTGSINPFFGAEEAEA